MKPEYIKIVPELNLKNIIAESREVAQALNEFADDLERIEKKYAELQESEVQNVDSSILFSKETNSFISCLKCENFSKEDNYCKLLQINWLPDNFGCNNGKEKVRKGK